MSRLTKRYKNGNITLDAAQFPPIDQTALDSEIMNSEPIRSAVKRLAELEEKQIPQKLTEHEDEFECSACGELWNYYDNDTERFDYCPHCGQRLGSTDNE